MTPLEQRITDLAEPIAAGAGFDLIRIVVSGKKSLTVQVMAERPDHTMTAEDCAILSRALSPIMDEADPIEGAYSLEVSSPGIDRPLVRQKDFHDWQGYEVKIELNTPIEGQKRFRGILGGLDGDNVCLDISGEEETALIPFEMIGAAKLVLTDELIRDSLRASKAAQKEGTNGALDGDQQEHDLDLEIDEETGE